MYRASIQGLRYSCASVDVFDASEPNATNVQIRFIAVYSSVCKLIDIVLSAVVAQFGHSSSSTAGEHKCVAVWSRRLACGEVARTDSGSGVLAGALDWAAAGTTDDGWWLGRILGYLDLQCQASSNGSDAQVAWLTLSVLIEDEYWLNSGMSFTSQLRDQCPRAMFAVENRLREVVKYAEVKM